MFPFCFLCVVMSTQATREGIIALIQQHGRGLSVEQFLEKTLAIESNGLHCSARFPTPNCLLCNFPYP